MVGLKTPGSVPAPAQRTMGNDATRSAVAGAAARVGTPFTTLMSLAAAESGFRAEARNPRSSAAGAFQFTESTWLEMVRRHGAAAGRPDLAMHIRADGSGRWAVDPAHRAAVMDARADFGLASQMAARYCEENRARLGEALGRPATEEEVRLAYFLGARGARRLIEAAETKPDMSVAGLMPQVFARHRAMLSCKNRPMTVAEALGTLQGQYAQQIAEARDLELRRLPARIAEAYGTGRAAVDKEG